MQMVKVNEIPGHKIAVLEKRFLENDFKSKFQMAEIQLQNKSDDKFVETALICLKHYFSLILEIEQEIERI